MITDKFIKMDNDYILEKIESENVKENVNDIRQITWSQIKRKKKLIVIIDFDKINVNEYKNILRRFYYIKNKTQKCKLDIGIENEYGKVIAYVINFDENNKKHMDFIVGINAILYSSIFEMYNYIYDYVCDYLDKQFIEYNLCNFKDDMCIAKSGTSCKVGCCRHFKYKKLLPIFPNKLVVCEYLKDKRCSAKCISCKLFTCDYLEKNGVKFRIKDILLLNTFFNPIQKYFIKYKEFTKKEDILKILLLFS